MKSLQIEAGHRLILHRLLLCKKFLRMKSIVTSKGQTVVPRKLRQQFKIAPGTTLDWQQDGDAIRVVKLALAPSSGGTDAALEEACKKANRFKRLNREMRAWERLNESD